MKELLCKVVLFAFVGLVASQSVPDPRCPLVNTRPPTHIPHATDCAQYYVCHLGNRVLMPPCPPGMNFDTPSSSCLPIGVAVCGNVATTVPPATTAPPGGVTTAPPGGVTTAPPGGVTTAPPGGVTTAPPGGVTTAPPATAEPIFPTVEQEFPTVENIP